MLFKLDIFYMLAADLNQTNLLFVVKYSLKQSGVCFGWKIKELNQISETRHANVNFRSSGDGTNLV